VPWNFPWWLMRKSTISDLDLKFNFYQCKANCLFSIDMAKYLVYISKTFLMGSALISVYCLRKKHKLGTFGYSNYCMLSHYLSE
jgi:hypothetical protein